MENKFNIEDKEAVGNKQPILLPEFDLKLTDEKPADDSQHKDEEAVKKQPILVPELDLTLAVDNSAEESEPSEELPHCSGSTFRSSAPINDACLQLVIEENIMLKAQTHDNQREFCGMDESISYMMQELDNSDKKSKSVEEELRASLEQVAQIHAERDELAEIVHELEKRNVMMEATLEKQKRKILKMEEALRNEKQVVYELRKALDALQHYVESANDGAAPVDLKNPAAKQKHHVVAKRDGGDGAGDGADSGSEADDESGDVPSKISPAPEAKSSSS